MPLEVILVFGKYSWGTTIAILLLSTIVLTTLTTTIIILQIATPILIAIITIQITITTIIQTIITIIQIITIVYMQSVSYVFCWGGDVFLLFYFMLSYALTFLSFFLNSLQSGSYLPTEKQKKKQKQNKRK